MPEEKKDEANPTLMEAIEAFSEKQLQEQLKNTSSDELKKAINFYLKSENYDENSKLAVIFRVIDNIDDAKWNAIKSSFHYSLLVELTRYSRSIREKIEKTTEEEPKKFLDKIVKHLKKISSPLQKGKKSQAEKRLEDEIKKLKIDIPQENVKGPLRFPKSDVEIIETRDKKTGNVTRKIKRNAYAQPESSQELTPARPAELAAAGPAPKPAVKKQAPAESAEETAPATQTAEAPLVQKAPVSTSTLQKESNNNADNAVKQKLIIKIKELDAKIEKLSQSESKQQ